ncbi:MAG: TIGR01212 family radical SAM protein [bacterium]|nr:TIGR01212 family radical SAM protein [bacterium]
MTSEFFRPDWHGKRYYSLDSYLKNTYGTKMYRLSLDGGFSCPNRDGTIGTSGCSFCSAGGSGDFAADRNISITAQLEQAKERIRNKATCTSYIAYFQAYTNTYADIFYLRTVFSEALAADDILILSIATRPDCIGDDVIALLCELRRRFQKEIWIELGVQTTCNVTLSHVRSGFTYETSADAIKRLADADIPVIVHLILGLPGENSSQMLHSLSTVCELPIAGLKLQLLHVLKNTALANEYFEKPFPLFSQEDYCQFIIDCIEQIPEHIIIHRITGDGPKNLLIAPQWSGNKKSVLNRIHNQLKERNTWQGRLYNRKEIHAERSN